MSRMIAVLVAAKVAWAILDWEGTMTPMKRRPHRSYVPPPRPKPKSTHVALNHNFAMVLVSRAVVVLLLALALWYYVP